MNRSGNYTSVVLAALLVLGGCSSEARPPDQVEPTSVTCAECHAPEFEAWSGSHHDLAMQHASPATVLADFAAPPLVWSRAGESHQAAFRSTGDAYFVRIEGSAAGAETEYRVAYTFGVTPLQQYLVEFPGGRLQCLPVAWDVLAKRWYHLDPNPPPGDAFHWTGRYQSWNMMCAECHSTELKKGYDAAHDTYTTTSAELDVGCRACHGPAGEHVRRARGWRTRAAPPGSEARGFQSGLAGGASLELETCAPCHSRRSALTEDWSAGQRFLDHFEPALLREGLYFPDGQILDEVYVWGSFAQSRMAAAGVVCSDCHDPHSLKLKLPEGPGHNELCVQCHSLSAPTERFPTLLAADYDTRAHHHHTPGSEAARCTTCHMPTRTYMGVDARRDHRLGLPRPDLSLELGVPNACATCHAAPAADALAAGDVRTNAELAAAIGAWGAAPSRAARRVREAAVARTFARALHLGSSDSADTITRTRAELVEIAEDADASDLQRATALELWGDLGGFSVEVLTRALREYGEDGDDGALIRAVAARALLQGARVADLGPLLARALEDPVRAVRVAAGAPEETAQRDAVNRDFPATWFQLGIEAQRLGDVPGAEAAWRRALEMDPDFTPAIHNLAVLLSGTGRGPAARDLLMDAVRRQPEDGELHYSLGLQLAELGAPEAAAEALLRAAHLMPERPRVAYNLGLLLESLGRHAEAESHLRRALGLQRGAPSSPEAIETTFALAGLMLREGRPDEARELARNLSREDPQAGEALLTEMERELGPRR